MADYTKQTWVDDDGSGGTGTVFTKARMDTIEEGIRVAGKQAVLVPSGSLGSPTDSNAVTWRRAADGALVAYVQVVESGVTPNRGVSAQDRLVAEGTGTGLVSRSIETVHKNTAGDTDIGARLVVSAQKGGRRSVFAQADTDSGGLQSVKIIDDLGASDLSRLTTQVGGALPSTPYDGQEVVYIADTTNGVAWRLKYRASDSKWYYIGGPPLLNEITAEQSHSLATYAALGTAGPSITVPLAGDYDVEIGCAGYTAGTNGYFYMSYDIGATGAVDADALEMRGTATGNVPQIAGSRRRRKTGLAAGTALVSKYRSSLTSGSGWKNRFMAVVPVRLG